MLGRIGHKTFREAFDLEELGGTPQRCEDFAQHLVSAIFDEKVVDLVI